MASIETACSPQLIDIILAGARGIVLIVAALAGTLSIYLGWKLYRDAVVSPTKGEAHFRGLTLHLAGGPGVFLAAFGSWLLVHLAHVQLEMIDTPQARTSLSSVAKGAFLTVATAADPPTKDPVRRDCIVPARVRRLFGGAAAPTPEQVSGALDTAIKDLQDIERGRLRRGEDKDMKRLEALHMLIEMKESLEEQR